MERPKGWDAPPPLRRSLQPYRIDQLNPLSTPWSSMSMCSAAGVSGRPGMRITRHRKILIIIGELKSEIQDGYQQFVNKKRGIIYLDQCDQPFSLQGQWQISLP
jgi:hypothetical protein